MLQTIRDVTESFAFALDNHHLLLCWRRRWCCEVLCRVHLPACFLIDIKALWHAPVVIISPNPVMFPLILYACVCVSHTAVQVRCGVTLIAVVSLCLESFTRLSSFAKREKKMCIEKKNTFAKSVLSLQVTFFVSL